MLIVSWGSLPLDLFYLRLQGEGVGEGNTYDCRGSGKVFLNISYSRLPYPIQLKRHYKN